MAIADLAQTRQIFRRWDGDAAGGRDRLGNHSGNGLWPFMLDQLFNGIDAVHVTGRIGMTVITAVTVRWCHVQGAVHKWAIIRLGHLARATDAHSTKCCTMVRATASNNFETFWEPGEILILPGNFDR